MHPDVGKQYLIGRERYILLEVYPWRNGNVELLLYYDIRAGRSFGQLALEPGSREALLRTRVNRITYRPYGVLNDPQFVDGYDDLSLEDFNKWKSHNDPSRQGK